MVFGLFRGDRIIHDWRLRTDLNTTADELFVSISTLAGAAGVSLSTIRDVAICCVVPSILYAFDTFCQKYLGIEPLIIQAHTPAGITVRIDNPAELGPDRLVNAAAAFAKYHQALVVVDFGTATTFDCVSQHGEHIGGAIAPGILISCEALFFKAAKLPREAIFSRPEAAIAKNTVAAMNAGVVYGFAGMVDGIVSRIKDEISAPVKIIATGGLAPLIASQSRTIESVDPHLTLEGLKLIYEHNRQSFRSTST